MPAQSEVEKKSTQPDRLHVRKKLMKSGFAEIKPPKDNKWYFFKGQYFDMLGNPVPTDKNNEGSTKGPDTPEIPIIAPVTPPEIPTKVTLDQVMPEGGVLPPDDPTKLDQRIHINGKPMEENTQQELLAYANDVMELGIHYNSGPEKIMKAIEAKNKKDSAE